MKLAFTQPIVKTKKQKKKQRKIKRKRPDPFEARHLIITCVFVFSDIGEGEHWPRCYETFLMLNPAEHEIAITHKYQSSQNQCNFQAKIVKASHLSC